MLQTRDLRVRSQCSDFGGCRLNLIPDQSQEQNWGAMTPISKANDSAPMGRAREGGPTGRYRGSDKEGTGTEAAGRQGNGARHLGRWEEISVLI